MMSQRLFVREGGWSGLVGLNELFDENLNRGPYVLLVSEMQPPPKK